MTDKGIYDLFYDILRELAEIKKNQWSKGSQEKLVETLIKLGSLMEQQTQVLEKHAELVTRIEKYLDEPEPEPLVS
jgi:hypothetical protein